MRRAPHRPDRRAAIRRLGAIGLGASFALPLGACRHDATRPPKDVRLGYLANITHATALLGVHSGDFARAVAPLGFRAQPFKAGPSVIEALFAGEIDVAYVGPSPALNAHLQSRGKGIRVIGGAAANGVVIVARKNSDIRRLEDLRGRRIATPQMGNTQDVSARHYVRFVLGQPDAENVIPIPNPEQASMMERGAIDAAWAVEPWGAALVAAGVGRIIAEEKELWPGRELSLTLVAADPAFLDRSLEVIERILETHLMWTDRLARDFTPFVPDLVAALALALGRSLPEHVISDALTRVRFTTDPITASLEVFARRAYEIGRARGIPKVESMLDLTLLGSLQQRIAIDRPGPASPRKEHAPR